MSNHENKFKLQKKLGRRCPTCSASLEIVVRKKDNGRGITTQDEVIRCSECDYTEKRNNRKRNYKKPDNDEEW